MIAGNVVSGKCESLRAAVRKLLAYLTVIADEDIRQNYQQILEKADSVFEVEPPVGVMFVVVA